MKTHNEIMEIIRKADGFISEKLIVLPNAILEEAEKHPLIRQFYLTDIGFFPRARYHYRERMLGCDSYIFIYCIEGKGWYSTEGQKRNSIDENTMIIIPANTPHLYGADDADPWSIYWFHIRGEDVAQFFAEWEVKDEVYQATIGRSQKVVDLFHECYELLQTGYSLNHMIFVSQALRYMLSSIYIYQKQQVHQVNKNHASVHRLIPYMSEHLETVLTLDDFAQHVNLSKSHLTYLFKKTTGFSPVDYYLRLKIQRACQYLDLTDQSVKEISLKLGFRDPYYFSRIFRKVMGISPAKYREMKKG